MRSAEDEEEEGEEGDACGLGEALRMSREESREESREFRAELEAQLGMKLGEDVLPEELLQNMVWLAALQSRKTVDGVEGGGLDGAEGR